MIKPIEQEFYEAFDIEKEQVGCRRMAMNLPACDAKNGCKYCEFSDYEYPPITDHISLQLITVLTICKSGLELKRTNNVSDLKINILKECIDCSEGIYTRVRKIMGVEEKWKKWN